MHRIGKIGIYSVSCYTLHSLLQFHYVGTCRGFFSFLSPTAYCQTVEACLHLLQLSPLLVAFPLLLRAREYQHISGGLPESLIDDAAQKKQASRTQPA
jgi:hypothetical protein